VERVDGEMNQRYNPDVMLWNCGSKAVLSLWVGKEASSSLPTNSHWGKVGLSEPGLELVLIMNRRSLRACHVYLVYRDNKGYS